MAKRGAEEDEQHALKAGERPVDNIPAGEGEEFEDEFEDEFESEDEVLEAGVDGRPDEEREAEEKASGIYFRRLQLGVIDKLMYV
nr:hypothetical protein CFP56_02999 [Quercus suber]